VVSGFGQGYFGSIVKENGNKTFCSLKKKKKVVRLNMQLRSGRRIGEAPPAGFDPFNLVLAGGAATGAYLANRIGSEVRDSIQRNLGGIFSTPIRGAIGQGRAPTSVQYRRPPRTGGRKYVMTSRSAGKLKRKSYKKVKRKGFKASSSKKGIVKTVEKGGVVADLYCVHLMHHSFPILEIMKVSCIALAKRLVEKQFGVQIANLKQLFGDFTSAAFTGNINYYVSSGTSTTSSAAFTVLTSESIEQLGLNILGALTSVFSANVSAELWKIRIYPTTFSTVQRHTEINLRTLKFDIYCKSSLKMQNRSKNPLGSEADEVDNVPVYGKSYQINGSAYLLNDQHRTGATAFTPYIASQDHGFTALQSSSDGSGALREPPVNTYFANCRKAAKIRIEPGHIKTSVLTTKKVVSFVSLLNSWLPYFSSNQDSRFRNPMGVTRMFSLEKIIETVEGIDAPTVNIEIGFENNNQYIIKVREAYTPMAAQLFEKK